MPDLILNTIDLEQIEVKENTVIALQLPNGDLEMAEELIQMFDNAFGDLPYIVIIVDDVKNIKNLPAKAMAERGWQPFEIPTTWFEKLMRRWGWVKVKE